MEVESDWGGVLGCKRHCSIYFIWALERVARFDLFFHCPAQEDSQPGGKGTSAGVEGRW